MWVGEALGAARSAAVDDAGGDRRLLLGVGNRGQGLAWIAAPAEGRHNLRDDRGVRPVDGNRERAAERPARRVRARAARVPAHGGPAGAEGRRRRAHLDGRDFQHRPLLKIAAEAGKHAYVEKPIANVLEEAKAARDAVREPAGRIVQVGTQHRSEPYQIRGARRSSATGALGEVSKVEIVWNYHGPRWRGRPEVKQIREQDTDWRRWLLGKPYRPFDPQAYFEFRLYRDFSSGIADQWMSHGIDLVHYFMDDHFPRSVVAHGGVFAWHDGRENPDTFQALVEYPKGFLVSYSTSFGNDCDSFTRIMGKKATLVNVGGEGSPRWKVVEEKGNHEDDPDVKRAEKFVTLPGDDECRRWASTTSRRT